MNLTIIISELNSRIKDLENEIRHIEEKYIPEHNQRPERDKDWQTIKRNWEYMIQDRKDKIQQIKEQIEVAIKIPIE